MRILLKKLGIVAGDIKINNFPAFMLDRKQKVSEGDVVMVDFFF